MSGEDLIVTIALAAVVGLATLAGGTLLGRGRPWLNAVAGAGGWIAGSVAIRLTPGGTPRSVLVVAAVLLAAVIVVVELRRRRAAA